MKNEVLTIGWDGWQTVPIADLRDVPLAQLVADDDARSMVCRILGSAADQPRICGATFSSVI